MEMKKQTMTVGFADLTNFTRLTKSTDSNKVIDILQDAFKVAGDSIIRHGGQIRKYIGDSIFFTFIDPDAAMLATKEIATGYNKVFNELTVRFNVAIATGDVIECRIGHPSYLIEDVMGEVVNQAALLLKEAHHNENRYAICDETRRIISG